MTATPAMRIWTKRLIQLAGLIFLAWLSFKILDWKTVAKTVTRIPLTVALALVLAELLFYWIESLRIRVLLDLRFDSSFILRTRLLSAFFANFMPGLGAGEIVRVLLLDQRRPGQKWFIALALIANRIFGLLSLFGLIGIYFLVDYPSFIARALPGAKLAIVCASFALFCFPLLLNAKWARRVGIAVVALLKGKRLYRLMLTAYIAVRRYCRPSKWARVSFSSVLTSLIAVTQMWLVAISVGIKTNFMDWVLFTPFIALSAFLPVGIGAFGSQDLAVAFLAKAIGQPLESFIALSLVIHAARIIGTLPGVLFFSDAYTALKAMKKTAQKNRLVPVAQNTDS